MTFWCSFQGLLVAAAVLDRWLPALQPRLAVWRGRGLLGLALIMPWIPLAPEAPLRWAPTAEVWQAAEGASERARVSLPVVMEPSTVPGSLDLLPWLVLVPGALWALGSLMRVLWMLQKAQSWRRIGHVQVLVSADSKVPWSFALFGRAYVLLDVETFADAGLRELAIGHELQHHRVGDTAWAWAFWAVDAISAINPWWWWWRGQLVESEELACDEALVKAGVDRLAYSEALLAVGRRAVSIPVLLSGFSSPVWKSQLGRRVHMLLRGKASNARWTLVAAALGLAGVAWAGDRWVVDHRVSRKQALEIVQEAGSPGFPLVVNDQVLEQLNRLVATPKGRAFAKNALDARETHRAFVESEIAKAGLPTELAAVPFVESGYRNLTGEELYPHILPAQRGAGLWMFIPSTARTYGMRVGAEEDQRLDIPLETDAALRLLSDLHAEFGDWGLALAAYNQGPSVVRRAIQQEGTRDIWKLMKSGALNSYVAQVVAAAILLEEPSLAE